MFHKLGFGRSRGRTRGRVILGTALLLALGAFAVACVFAPADAHAAPQTILIVAPHPDDEALIGAGVISAAHTAGDTVKIVYMTNGDFYDGPTGGLARENEAVTAEGILGTSESDLLFLGYPDGGLNAIWTSYTGASDAYTTSFGQSVTYGDRGFGSSDYHYAEFGSHAKYNAPDILTDLGSILSSYKPDIIYTTGPLDALPDHYTTYWFVRRAILQAEAADNTYRPTLYTSIVHWTSDTSWPAAADPTADFTEPPNFDTNSLVEQEGLTWAGRDSVVVPAAMQSTTLTSNPKYEAISAYDSTGADGGFLGNFVHHDEIFWPDNLSNHGPASAAGTDQTVVERSTVQLDGSGSYDIDGDSLTYTWHQNSGTPVTLSSTSAVQPTFTAPTAPATLAFQLKVNDGTVDSGASYVTITVNRAAPIAVAGTDQNVIEQNLVHLDGTGSTDPDGHALTYAWTQTSGPSVTLSSASAAQPTFTAPAAPATLVFSLKVNDGYLDSSTSTVTITVGQAAPLAVAGADQSVIERSLVHLDGTGSSDPDGHALTYAWTQTSGPSVTLSSASAAQPTFTAPVAPATLVFSLKVNDGYLDSTTSTVTITVTRAAPIAAAGTGQSVMAQSLVHLDGTGSTDPDGHALTYAWTQTSGPSVTLSSASAAQPTFTAPATSATLVFSLKVNDGYLDSSASTVAITVKAKTAVTIGKPTAPTSVKRGTKFTVYGSLAPRRQVGASLVKVKCYLKKHGKWVLTRQVNAKNVNHLSITRYSVRFALGSKGSWKLVASCAATSRYASATSKAVFIRVM